MNTAQELAANEARLLTTGVRRLTPDMTSLYEGTYSLLHCAVKNDTLYRGVFAVRMFPIRSPDRFISLHYTTLDDKDLEIGVIENLAVFPEKAQELVRRSLTSHYHEQIISRVYRIRTKYGLLFFDVETAEGPKSFIMPWRGDRAEEYGEKGKVLLDALDNRYIIPDVELLPVADQRRFTSYIYW